MSLAEMQSCLARLYVDETFRGLFRSDPGTAVGRYRLDDTEARAVRALDVDDVEEFALGLAAKRRHRMERVYVASFARDATGMAAVHRRFLETVGVADPSVRREIRAFGRFAERTLADPERHPPWAAELVRFERVHHDVRSGPPPPDGSPGGPDVLALRPGVRVEDFTVDVPALEEALRAGDRPDDVPPAPTTVVFRPPDGTGRPRLLRVNAPTAAVLRACGRPRPFPRVVADVERELGATGLGPAVRDVAGRLRDLGIVATGGDPA